MQRYEATGILAVADGVGAIDKRLSENRPRGLLAGIVYAMYFGMRLIAEHFEEFFFTDTLEPDPVEHVIQSIASADRTAGQCPSLPFIAIEIFLFARSLRLREPVAPLRRFDLELHDA